MPHLPVSGVALTNYEITFYETESGHTPIEDFLRTLKSTNRKAWKKCISYMNALQDSGLSLPRNYIAHLSGDVWELRPEFGNVEYRFLFGSIGPHEFGIVEALIKKQDKVPPSSIKRAQDRIEELQQNHA